MHYMPLFFNHVNSCKLINYVFNNVYDSNMTLTMPVSVVFLVLHTLPVIVK